MNDKQFDYMNGKFLIILTIGADNLYQIVEMIFNEFYALYIPNVYVLIKNGQNSKIFLYTYLTFNNNACHRPSIKLITTVNDDNINQFENDTNFDIFSMTTNIKNFHKCSLNVGIFNVGRFAIVTYDMDNDKFDYKGFEVQIVNIIAEKLQFTINFVYVTDWGLVPEEGSGEFSGAMKMVCLNVKYINSIILIVKKEFSTSFIATRK